MDHMLPVILSFYPTTSIIFLKTLWGHLVACLSFVNWLSKKFLPQQSSFYGFFTFEKRKKMLVPFLAQFGKTFNNIKIF